MRNALTTSRVINNIGPRICIGGSVIHGAAIDTAGFGAARAILTVGRAFGFGQMTYNWGFKEASSLKAFSLEAGPHGDLEAVPLFCGRSNDQRLSWCCFRLGTEAGRKRYVRAFLKVSGFGFLPAAVTIELYRSVEHVPGYETATEPDFGPPEGWI